MDILIIKTFASGGHISDNGVKSFTSNILQIQPTARIVFCGATDGEAIPDVNQYDLIVITGGKFDLLTKEPDEWVVQIMDMVRRLEADKAKKPKLFGICWGHQVIHKALGGQLGALAEGPRVCGKRPHSTMDVCSDTSFGKHTDTWNTRLVLSSSH
jgi:GMP synthase-like glutamine amidotransferase